MQARDLRISLGGSVEATMGETATDPSFFRSNLDATMGETDPSFFRSNVHTKIRAAIVGFVLF